MESQTNKIAIFGSRSHSEALPGLPPLFEFLKNNRFRVYIHTRFFEYLEKNNIDTQDAVPVDHIPQDVSMVMSIGGDGTFLRTARWIGDKQIPVLGINTGHLGFLSSCRLEGVADMMTDICNGNIEIEKRMVLEVEGDALPKDMKYALNEITFMRDGSSSMLSAMTFINGNFLADYRGDGLIISTPTGSTAYSLSAGGPVIEPTIDCLCLCPVAPHTLTLRPLVAGGDAIVEVNPESRSHNFTLSLDDRSIVLPSSGIYKIKRAPFSVILIRKKGTGFASILREKLLWSAGLL